MAALTRYFLKLAYNGSSFSGWQFQPNAPTIQEALEFHLSSILHEKITCVGCGRTDAGVHATKYFAHIDAARDDLHVDEKFIFRLNKSLPPGIVVHKIIQMPYNAHARFSALLRSYEYYITGKKNPFGTNMAWLYHEPLNVDEMRKATDLLLRYDDFIAFSKTGNTMRTSICKLAEAYWKQDEDKLVFRITSNRFLRNMVRSIVGNLVDVGRGRITVQDFERIITERKQVMPGLVVPAEGLFLMDITYPPDFNL